MKHLMCIFDLFDINQKIHLMDPEAKQAVQVAAVPVADLPKALAQMAHIYDVNNIKLYGCKSYGEIFPNTILEYLKTDYNKNNVEIEVI